MKRVKESWIKRIAMKKTAPLIILMLGMHHLLGAQTFWPIQSIQPLLDPGSAFVALSGYHGALQVTGSSETHHPGIPTTRTLNHLGADGYLAKWRTGIGAYVSHYNFASGTWNTWQFGLRAAPKFTLAHGTLLTGFGYEFFQTRYNWYMIDWDQGIDPLITLHAPWSNDPYLETRNGHAAIGSVGYHYGRWLGVYQFRFSSQQGFLRESPAFQEFEHTLMVNYMFPLGERTTITPGVNYRRIGDINELKLSLNAHYRGLFIGAGVATRNAAFAQIGYQVKETVLISYAYKQVSHTENSQNLGSHSIGIRTTLGAKKAKDVLIQNLWLL